MKMSVTLTSLISLALTYSINLSAGKVTYGKRAQSYASEDYKVTILRYGEPKENKFLVKVAGLDNDFDGQIYLHEKKCDNKSCSAYKYQTSQIPGKKKWWTIQHHGSLYYTSMSLFPPGLNKKSSLHKAKPTKDFSAEKFYKEYLNQLSLRKTKKK